MDIDIDDMMPVQPSPPVGGTGPVTAAVTSKTTVREISTKQMLTLQIINQRMDKEWFVYRDTFPTYSDRFLALVQMVSAISALILMIAYFVIIFQTSVTYHTFIFFLFIALVCMCVIGSALKTNQLTRLCYYECTILLNRGEVCFILVLLAMMYPFYFSMGNQLALAGTILNLIACALAGSVLLVWLGMRLYLLYHYSV